MKKIKKMIIMVFMLLVPVVVNADGKVISHYIDAEIEIAGALNVKELIIVEGDTSFIQRKLNYFSFGNSHWNTSDIVDLNNGIIYNGQSISIINISAFNFNDNEVKFGYFNENVTEYFQEFDIKNIKEKAYTFADDKSGTADLKIFYPTNNTRTAYYINYSINNVVVKHNDIKEINYSFKNLNLNAMETYLRVIIPYQTDSELYNVWVHGNQSGKVEEIVNSDDYKVGIIAKFSKIEDSINFRMTLPQEQVGIDIYLNNSEIDALDEIIKIEEQKLIKTNQNNTIINLMKYVLIVLGILYVIGSIIFIKLDIKIIYIIYLVFGIVIMLFNYLFKFNYWYLYLILLAPILVKLTQLLLQKKKNPK